MTAEPRTTPDDFGDVVDIREDGILWMLNRTVFHPRGFALAITPDETNLVLHGDGEEPWNFADDIPEDERFRAFERMLHNRRVMAREQKAARAAAEGEPK